MSETELINGCKRKENHARKELYEIHAEAMLRICFRYTGQLDIAYDLLHDGFLKVFSAIDNFESKGEGSLTAWMSKLFTNQALEYLRKKDLLRQSMSLEDVDDKALDDEPDASLVPIDTLMHFITELPTGYRTVFNLYVFEEWPHREIAQKLNINEKSSASQLVRARKLLAERIRDYLKKNG